MGKIASKLKAPLLLATDSVTDIISGRKRKREDDDLSDDYSALHNSLHVPKKKKLLTTTQYIYQALFKEQKNSDVAVMALGKIWHLHKVYLCQSPYFASMFNGSWREACQDFINIKIVDPKITIESLETVFGSLYLDEIIIEPLGVVSVLATATLFQLDGIIERCTEVMIETTNAETAVPYYEAGCQYGVQNVKTSAFDWLLANLVNFYIKRVNWLKLIGVDLMADLVGSHNLYVMQTEFSLYTLLRTWAFLKIYPNYDPNESKPEIEHTPQTYFTNRADKMAYLNTPEGRKIEKAFRVLRIQHLLNHHMDLKLVLDDNIIPKEWFQHHLLSHWNAILKIDHTLEAGPEELDSKIFFDNCLRCGRVLQEQGYQKWRWTGFNFGLDLVLIADTRVLSIKRHHRAENERLLSLQTKRQFLIRVTLASLNEQRQVAHTQTTDIKSLCLEKNEETSLMLMDKELTYPLLISVNLLVVSPDTKPIENIENEATATSQTPISDIGGNAESNRIVIKRRLSQRSPSL